MRKTNEQKNREARDKAVAEYYASLQMIRGHLTEEEFTQREENLIRNVYATAWDAGRKYAEGKQ